MGIEQYKIQRILHKSKRSEILLVEKVSHEIADQKVVMKKSLRHNDSLITEFERLNRLKHPNIISTIELAQQEEYVLIREYFEGETLKTFLQDQPLDLEIFFHIATHLAETLMFVHEKGYIYNNISPHNILIDPTTLNIMLIGFGHTLSESDIEQGVSKPNTDPAYQAPEQTGRINQDITYRADIYSMGILFYEMLGQRLPFSAKDSLSLLHSHLAKDAPFLSEINTTIPKVLSKIVHKMMAKRPNERYRTLASLLADLHICQNALKSKQGMMEFEINRFENTFNNTVDQKLYDRKNALNQILTTFRNIDSKTSTLTLVNGASGVGKSSLIKAALQEIPNPGYQINVKFDQFQRSNSFELLHNALKELILQILSLETGAVLKWKSRLLKSMLSAHIQVLVEIVPELEILVGPQPVAEKLPAVDTKIRLNKAINHFLLHFCHEEKPLIIFLDDLQWADSATLEWLQAALYEVTQVIVIGSYRDNEVVKGHPLHNFLNRLNPEAVSVKAITLNSLSKNAIAALITDRLHLEKSDANDIAEAILTKTEGNPFFVTQYMEKLQEDQILWFDTKANHWQYNVDKILQSEASHDVISFLTHRMQALSESVQEVLKLAACIGNQFSLQTLYAVADPVLNIEPALEEALKLGWINKLNQSHQDQTIYAFSHDRVQQVAWSLFSEHELQLTHLTIGRHIQHEDKLNDKDSLLQAVEHLNRAEPIIRNLEEKYQLAELNYKAALHAKNAGDFQQALTNIILAMYLFDNTQRQPQEEVSLLRERAECEHLCGNNKRAKQYYESAIAKAKTDLDKGQLYELMINFYADISEFQAAYQLSCEAVKLFNITLPSAFNPLLFVRDFIKISWQLRNHEPKDLISLPSNKNAHTNIIIRLLSASLKAAYQIEPKLCVYVAIKLIRICLKEGNTREAVIGYMVFGVIFQGAVRGKHQLGHEYGQLALAMLDKFNNDRQKAEVNFVYGYFANSWINSVKDTEKYWITAYNKGLEMGDWFHTSFASAAILQNQFMSGVPLTQISEDSERFIATLQRIDGKEQYQTIRGIQQAIKNIQGKTPSSTSFSDDQFNENDYLEIVNQFTSRHLALYYYVNKMTCLYLKGHYELAAEVILDADKCSMEAEGMLHNTERLFYKALILAKTAKQSGWIHKYRFIRSIQKTVRSFKQWSKDCPTNFQTRYELLNGELLRLKGHTIDALSQYELASESAKRYGYLHIQAIANQLSASLYQQLGQPRAALMHQKQADKCLQGWGKLISDDVLIDTADSHTQSNTLDTETLLKSSETINKQRRLPELLKTLIELVIENAGAQRGVLLLNDANQLIVQAESTLSEEANVLQNLPLNEHEALPLSIINYVFHTKKPIVVNNAIREAIFATDKDIIKRQVHSVICAPLEIQGHIKGIIYLENNRIENAFNTERLKLIQYLSSQIAVSIENASVYDTLETKVAERTKDIEKQRQQLELQNKELENQNQTISRLNELLKEESEERLKVQEALEAANQTLNNIINTDELTQLHNHRSFEQTLYQVCSEKSSTATALVFCQFTPQNADSDAQLIELTTTLLTLASAKEKPFLARYDEHTFVFILTKTNLIKLENFCDQLIKILAKNHPLINNALHVGAAISNPNELIMSDTLLELAENALSEAKTLPKNLIIKQLASSSKKTKHGQLSMPLSDT